MHEYHCGESAGSALSLSKGVGQDKEEEIILLYVEYPVGVSAWCPPYCSVQCSAARWD